LKIQALARPRKSEDAASAKCTPFTPDSG